MGTCNQADQNGLQNGALFVMLRAGYARAKIGTFLLASGMQAVLGIRAWTKSLSIEPAKPSAGLVRRVGVNFCQSYSTLDSSKLSH